MEEEFRMLTKFISRIHIQIVQSHKNSFLARRLVRCGTLLLAIIFGTSCTRNIQCQNQDMCRPAQSGYSDPVAWRSFAAGKDVIVFVVALNENLTEPFQSCVFSDINCLL